MAMLVPIALLNFAFVLLSDSATDNVIEYVREVKYSSGQCG